MQTTLPYLKLRKYMTSPAREKARGPRGATTNEANSRAMPSYGLKFHRTYERLTFSTGRTDPHASIKLHSERRSF